MDTEQAVTESTPESEGYVEESTPATETDGHPEKPQPEDSKPAPDPSSYEERYKEIQKFNTRLAEENARFKDSFSRFGGIESANAVLNHIISDPKSFDFIRDRLRNPNPAEPEPTYDEDTAKALKIVDSRIVRQSKELETRVNQLLEARLGPILQNVTARESESIFRKMDETHDGWREYLPEMKELAKTVNSNGLPSFDDMEDVFLRAVRRKGDLDKWAEKRYEKKLLDKKAKSTDKPNGSRPASAYKPKTLMEALTLAEKKHGVSVG